MKNKIIKGIFWAILGLLTWIALAKLTHYNERMEEYNRYGCATYGYEEDCKTPLTPERRLK